MQLPFAGGPIVVSFNILSWTLSKTNDFTKHAHELNHLKFYSVFNLSGQYQGRFWLVCSNAQSSLHLRWSPMIKIINIFWADLYNSTISYHKPLSENDETLLSIASVILCAYSFNTLFLWPAKRSRQRSIHSPTSMDYSWGWWGGGGH